MSFSFAGRISSRSLAGLATVLLLGLLVALLLLAHRDTGPGSAAGGAARQAGLSAGSLPAGWITRTETVRRGDTLSRLLLRNDVYLRDIERVVQEVRGARLFDIRRLLPGETVELELDTAGRLRRLTYRKGPDRIYVIEGDEYAFTSHRAGVPYDTYLRRYGGVVATTIDEVLRASGADPAVVVRLAEIFASDIDFLTEPRAGDQISVLVEEKRYQGERLGPGTVCFAAYEGKRARQTAVRFGGDEEEPDGAATYYTPAGHSLVRAFLRSPLNYRGISSRFTQRRFHPILRVWRPHLGIDYAAPSGTPVVSIGDGVVEFAGWNGGFGRQLRIRHDASFVSCYGHLSRISKGLRPGARVTRGEVVGAVGSTGLSTGPHLDFRLQCKGAYVDPHGIKNPPSAPIPVEMRARFAALVARLTAVNDSLPVGQAMLWRRADDAGSRGPATDPLADSSF